MKEAEELLGRKLKNTEKLLIENMYDASIWDLGKDKNGNLILNRKNATEEKNK